MQVHVAVQLDPGETFGPSEETAAKGILKACGGTLAADVCVLTVHAPMAPVIVGKSAEPMEPPEEAK